MFEHQVPVTFMKSSNSSLELVNSKWHPLMSTTNVAEESGLKYFLQLFVRLLLVILRLLKKYPGWRRIKAAYTAVSSVSL
jgi:hypothetical protein